MLAVVDSLFQQLFLELKVYEIGHLGKALFHIE